MLDPALTDPPLGNGANVLNKNQQGFDLYGNPILNNSGLPTKFPLSGNPVSGSGEIEGIKHGKDDRRFLLSSCPFSMAPNDSQEIVVGITVGFRGNYLSNITDLKGKITSLSKSTILEVHSSNNSPKRSFSLIGNYPNPFNPSTIIEFNLETGSTISIDIFNLLVQKIKSIQNGYLTNGKYSVKWNGKDEKGKSVGSGLYFARISDGKMSVTQKLILEK